MRTITLNKYILRSISFLLVPCLIVDPAIAYSLNDLSSPVGFMNERVFEEDALAGVAAWMIDSWNTVGPSARRLIQVPVFDQAPSWWPSWAPAPAKLAIIDAISLLEWWSGGERTGSSGEGTYWRLCT